MFVNIGRRLSTAKFVVIAGVCVGGCGQPPAEPSAQPVAPNNADVTASASTIDEADAANPTTANSPEKVAAEHLPNAWRIHPKVISGGLPEGELAFKELEELGVKTVISVDGAKPDVALAKAHGLRYVHLPHGYDGVPENRKRELAKAVRDLEGPIYIHCHHGKHRSPAAATVACVGAGLLNGAGAEAVLVAAGTSTNYRGLYESARTARKFEQDLLDELQTEFPETAKLAEMAEAMVALEHTFDRVKLIEAAGWLPPADHPDLVPEHEALLLREHFTELLRSEAATKQPEAFADLLRKSETASQELETALRSWKDAGRRSPPPAEIGEAFARVSADCKSCHTTFRDVPLSEKNP